MKKIVFFALIVFISNSLFSQTNKPRVAVMPLEAKGVSSDLADGVTELLVTEVSGTGEFDVIERSQMKKILSEQVLQASGLADPSGAAEAGKLLSAKKMIVGSVSSFDFGKVVNIRLIDVETGKVEIADRQIAESEKKLLDSTKKLAYMLAAFITGKPIKKDGKTYSAVTATAFSMIKVLSAYENQVEISGGKDDGLKVGDRLIIYMIEKGSGDEHSKEEIRLTKVMAGSSKGEIVPMIKEQEYIVAGDLVKKKVGK
jgi:TolB-like protein